jgi:hypothetical protein
MRSSFYSTWTFGQYRPPLSGDQCIPEEYLPFGANFAARASVMRGVRFDEAIGPRGRSYATGEDTRLLGGLASRGVAMRYLPAASVQHAVGPQCLTPRWWWRRAFSIGREHGLGPLPVSWTPMSGRLDEAPATIGGTLTRVFGATLRRACVFDLPIFLAWSAGFLYERWRETSRGSL